MASYQKILLLGHLGKDVETRYLPSGDAVATFSVATSEVWKDKSGEKVERTEWWNITAFGKQAEVAAEYLKKGSPVFIEGRGRTEKWQDQDGNNRYTFKVIVDRLQLIAAKGGSSEAREHADAPAEDPRRESGRSQPAGTTSKKPEPGKGGGKHFDDLDDDIPF